MNYAAPSQVVKRRAVPLRGLDEAEVTASRRLHGANRVSARKTRGFYSRLLENMGDPMIKILLIALGINVVFLLHDADWYETAGIAVAIFLAVSISTLSEIGSESAFKRLQEESARVVCRVFRGCMLTEVRMEDIVVGDLVQLQAGDRVVNGQ